MYVYIFQMNDTKETLKKHILNMNNIPLHQCHLSTDLLLEYNT